MAMRTNLDMNVLRTFVTGFELGSFAKAADRLGRSQSAISTQLRRLEQQVGQPLVRKSGRGLGLTTAGESLLSYAKRLLELNDEAVESIRGVDVEGWVRLGLVQDFSENWLPVILQQFSRAHPKVRVEVQVDRSIPLVEKTRKAELDIALVWGEAGDAPHARRIADLPVRWIGPKDWPGVASFGSEPVPIVAFGSPCVFRKAAIDALDQAGIAWRLALTSPSLSGLRAAAQAGLGITVRTALDLPSSLIALDPATTGLPHLPRMPVTLHGAEAEPSHVVRRLTDILVSRLRDDDGLDAWMP